MPKDWNFIFSVVTALVGIVTAIVAIFSLGQTRKQIKLSNKQHLFDKRVENYLIATGLIQLYRNNCMHFNDEKDEPMFSVDLDFTWLTNNTYLEEITPAIHNPLKEPSHKELLIKLEDLKEVATKIKFLFYGKSSILLGDFILRYQELLFSMYQYQIILDKMNQVNEGHRLTIEEAQQKVGEKKYRIKLQDAFDNLKQADIMLKKENVEEKIKKQIKLY